MIFSVFLIVIGCYLIGSLPYGLILVKIFKGQDLRQIGSKNIGATNVLRAGYPVLALMTLVLDSFKGALSVLLVGYFYDNVIISNIEINLSMLAGVSAVLGHIFPVWLKFKGGKGVATGFGTILIVDPLVSAVILIVWLLTAIITKYSSLSAILATLALPILVYFMHNDVFYYVLFISCIILFKHKSNIIKLINKEETKITFKKK